MIQLHTSIDPVTIKRNGPTCFMTERNGNEVRCGMCARVTYVDTETYQFGVEVIRSGLDNPFLCETCVLRKTVLNN
jgi:hypothetical protein